MKRKTTVSVKSHQYIDGDITRSLVTSDGVIEHSETSCTLSYCENLGEGGTSDCVIEAAPARVVITRKGSIDNIIEIIPETPVKSVYRTELGEFPLTVTGKRITIKHSDKKTEITAYYYLDFGSSGDVLNKVFITAEYGDIINE